ncbi:uncharacterized protein LOC132183091 [Corylus avellana]|uniref:uncharacterized protein LOC132183091 n=1 Tax=Corylus avellana TaxID=13451 RepID=UPI001E2180CE|nr:uncharacterized protein LOC132183091 [Corylus avellana]
MKFFFRSCYRPKGAPALPPPEEEPNADSNTNTHVSASLTVPSSRRNRLSSTTASKSASAAAKHWRPALSMISEDNAAHQIFDKNGAARVSVKKSSGKPRSLGNSRSLADVEDYSCRNKSPPIIFPSFSPTPFMF